jgi:hypothetical protein
VGGSPSAAAAKIQLIPVHRLAGSSKSYLAREFGRLIEAPVTHLDAEYLDDEWNPLPMEKFEARQRDLVASARWLVDGNYNSTLHVRLGAADDALDAPARRLPGLHDSGGQARWDEHGDGLADVGGGTVTSTGRAYQLRYLQVVKVRDGRITLWRDHWDPLASAELHAGAGNDITRGCAGPQHPYQFRRRVPPPTPPIADPQ